MNRAFHFLAGAVLVTSLAALPCCQSMTLKVPATASREAGGSGNVVYRAAETGQLYVYDRNADKMCYSGLVHAGQLVLVDSDNNRIMVDGRPVVEQIPLNHNDQYDIYLDRDQRPAVVEKRTVIEREIHE